MPCSVRTLNKPGMTFETNKFYNMATVFKASGRRFEENAGRIDKFRLMSDAALIGKRPETRNLNFDVRQLNPGEYSSLYHFHRNAEELFMIVSGEATLRTNEGLESVGPGDVVFLEMGETGAHQLYNHTDTPCIYLDIRTFTGCDVAEYPDSGKILVVPGMETFRKGSTTGYFDGETNPDETWSKLKNK